MSDMFSFEDSLFLQVSMYWELWDSGVRRRREENDSFSLKSIILNVL